MARIVKPQYVYHNMTERENPLSTHDHGNCEMCDEIERQLDAANELLRNIRAELKSRGHNERGVNCELCSAVGEIDAALAHEQEGDRHDQS